MALSFHVPRIALGTAPIGSMAPVFGYAVSDQDARDTIARRKISAKSRCVGFLLAVAVVFRRPNKHELVINHRTAQKNNKP